MLSILVTGGSGLLGRNLAALSSPEADVRAPGSAELDVLDAPAVTEAISGLASLLARKLHSVTELLVPAIHSPEFRQHIPARD
jgi:hypothetical protein